MISFNDVTKKFNKEVALRNVSFDIKKGEFVFLAGVSGSGKSTLLRMLCREVKPTTGNILIFGKKINKMNPKKLRRRMGIVFQDYKLLHNKTVLENIAYPLACLGMNPMKVKKKALAALERVQMQEFKNKMPEELSGGQQQRVAIARAIVTGPELLICDEPTGNLDMEHTWTIMQHLVELNQAGTTIVMTTHNEEVLAKMNKRIVRLHIGEMVEDTHEEGASHFVDEESVIQRRKNENVNGATVVGDSFSTTQGTTEVSDLQNAAQNEEFTNKEKEMSILRNLGWTEEDEKNFQEKFENKKRKMEGRQ